MVLYKPSDADKSVLWEELSRLNDYGELSSLHSALYFYDSCPLFELYDLKNDPCVISCYL